VIHDPILEWQAEPAPSDATATRTVSDEPVISRQAPKSSQPLPALICEVPIDRAAAQLQRRGFIPRPPSHSEQLDSQEVLLRLAWT